MLKESQFDRIIAVNKCQNPTNYWNVTTFNLLCTIFENHEKCLIYFVKADFLSDFRLFLLGKKLCLYTTG